MPHKRIQFDEATWRALRQRETATGVDLDRMINMAVRDFLGIGRHTVFQISTAGALVEGISQGAASVAEVREHGDTGLGTFEALDGEMIVLDGVVYRVDGDGHAAVADDSARTPFAVVTYFDQSQPVHVEDAFGSLGDLTDVIDRMRASENVFYVVRVDGTFAQVRTRSTCRTRPGVGLATAAATQSEFDLREVTGTMIGFWSPAYMAQIGVTGYHLHFLTADHRAGGHVLDCRGTGADVHVQAETGLELALPANGAFLAAEHQHRPPA